MTEAMGWDTIDSRKALLELEGKRYQYDRDLDPIADLLEQGPQAVAHLSVKARDLGQIQKDMRDRYRAAVEAGVLPAGQDKDNGFQW